MYVWCSSFESASLGPVFYLGWAHRLVWPLTFYSWIFVETIRFHRCDMLRRSASTLTVLRLPWTFSKYALLADRDEEAWVFKVIVRLVLDISYLTVWALLSGGFWAVAVAVCFNSSGSFVISYWWLRLLLVTALKELLRWLLLILFLENRLLFKILVMCILLLMLSLRLLVLLNLSLFTGAMWLCSTQADNFFMVWLLLPLCLCFHFPKDILHTAAVLLTILIFF
jgi:hypothetical protein